MEVDGRSYNLVLASDIERDGMGLECRAEGVPEPLLLEAFWHDPTGRFTFEAFQGLLPFALVEEFVRVARQRLPQARSEAADGGAYGRLRPETGIESCGCSDLTSVLLIVGLLTVNPLHCGVCRREVDPERLALTAKEVDAIANWYRSANALYELYLDSGEYEEYARERLLDPKGQINVEGLALAGELSREVPTEMWFFRQTEAAEPTHCPVCGSPLDVNVLWGSGRCRACRLHI